MSDLQEIPSRDILDYIKAYSHKFNGCLTGEVFQDAIKEIERLRNILSEMSVIASYSGWVSVNDRLPEKEGEYLVYYLGSYVVREFKNGKFRYWSCSSFEPDNEVSHWMPLPHEPREDER